MKQPANPEEEGTICQREGCCGEVFASREKLNKHMAKSGKPPGVPFSAWYPGMRCGRSGFDLDMRGFAEMLILWRRFTIRVIVCR